MATTSARTRPGWSARSRAAAVLAVMALTVGVSAAVGAAATPSPAPRLTTAPVAATVRPLASGWLVWWDLDTGVQSVVGRPELFRDAAVTWFRVTTVSTVVEQEPGSQPPESDLVAAMAKLATVGVRPYVTVTDAGFTAAPMARLLGDATRRGALVTALADTAQRVGAQGVDVDFESMNVGRSGIARTQVKRRFPVFLAELRDRLHLDGVRLSVAVPPRTGPRDPSWEVFDYPAIGAAVDRVRVMTYDRHVAGGSPGPVAPLAWVDDVAAYAGRVFGRRASLGVPAYGYNWYLHTVRGTCPSGSLGVTDTSGTARQLVGLAVQHNVTPRYVPSVGEFTYDYVYRDPSGVCRTLRRVWFEDTTSVRAKLALMDRRRLGGIAFWRLGGERPATWRVVARYAAG